MKIVLNTQQYLALEEKPLVNALAGAGIFLVSAVAAAATWGQPHAWVMAIMAAVGLGWAVALSKTATIIFDAEAEEVRIASKSLLGRDEDSIALQYFQGARLDSKLVKNGAKDLHRYARVGRAVLQFRMHADIPLSFLHGSMQRWSGVVHEINRWHVLHGGTVDETAKDRGIPAWDAA